MYGGRLGDLDLGEMRWPCALMDVECGSASVQVLIARWKVDINVTETWVADLDLNEWPW